MRILVTGAAGFLGWNLTRELRKRHPEATIVGVDNMMVGIRRPEEYCDLKIADCAHFTDHGLFDYIYHMASPASPLQYQRKPLATIHANVDGLRWCMQRLLAHRGVIFFASSSEVYGDPLISPQPESYKGSVSTTGPRACYDESKRLGETICVEWKKLMPQMGVKIARLFNVYGPGTLPEDGRCMSNFIWDAMHNRPVTIYGDGLQTRCFTYVDNVINAIVKLTEDTGDFVGPVNIGIDVETNVRDIAVAVISHAQAWRTKKRLPGLIPHPVYLPAPADDPRQRLPDLTLARQILGWDTRRLIPYHGPTGGIARTILHFEKEYWTDEADHNDPQPSVEPANTQQPVREPAGEDRTVGAAEPV